MITTNNIMQALKSKDIVTYCGDNVVAVNKPWNKPEFEINLQSGASIIATDREIRNMNVMLKKRTVYVAYYSQYFEAINNNDLSICIKTYQVDVELSDIKDFSFNSSSLNNCEDIKNDVFHKKIILKPFEIEAYLNYDKALSEVKKYCD
jgi:hypothetical protein